MLAGEAKNKARNNGLKSDEQIVLELVKADPEISKIEITKETGYSRSKVQKITNALQEKKIVGRKGGRKGGSWRVVESKKQ